MRMSVALAVLPALSVVAEEQQPLGDRLKAWFNKATDYIPSSIPIPSVVPDPLDAGASKVAEVAVHQDLNITNFKDTLLTPATKAVPAGKKSPTEEEWLIYVNGGNKSCYGLCKPVEKAWNTSVALLSALPNAPHLATIDCESFSGSLLCAQLNVNPPSIYHVLIPRPYTPDADVAVRYIHLNHSDADAAEIAAIHTKKEYLKKEPYTGIFQPFNGLLVQYGLAVPVAYALWAFAKMPSWLPMIAISFLSRSFMGRRMPQARPQAGAAGAAPAAQ